MKTEVRINGQPVVFAGEPRPVSVELWYNDTLIGTVEGAEGPGVQVASSHPMLPQWQAEAGKVVIKIASEPPSAQSFPPHNPGVVVGNLEEP